MGFTIGQRWISEMEPELGLGIVAAVEQRTVTILFPAGNVKRRYAQATGPIRRARFEIGARITTREELGITVESVTEVDGLQVYHGQGHDVPETALADAISFSTPEQRLGGGHFDPLDLFELRQKALQYQHRYRQASTRGFLGGRIDVLPHQFYIAHEVCARKIARVLLADEVGLGKTIEAALIIHRLLATGRISRVLICVPPALVNQWFVELLRRFNLIFRVADDAYCRGIETSDPDANPFLEAQLLICDFEYIVNTEQRRQQVAAADWDLLVLDEAHHIRMESPAYRFTAELATGTPGVLLLTATPEQLGERSHFARLRLLDPDRFHDFELYRQQADHYADVARLVEEVTARRTVDQTRVQALIRALPPAAALLRPLLSPDPPSEQGQIQQLAHRLLDLHGTGRVMFRNTRSAMRGFPERRVHLMPLEPETAPEGFHDHVRAEFLYDTGDAGVAPALDPVIAPRVQWLAGFLANHRNEKVLLICRTRQKATAIQKALKPLINLKSALFHEKIPLVERDRHAAWFAETNGAQILICSEIGSEGRNFQFARHLVLFDLPLDPELLEQRIGRLDRIGQTQTIAIHVPAIADSPYDVLSHWYHQGLNAFETQLPAGNRFLRKFLNPLKAAALHGRDPDGAESLAALIGESREYREDLLARLAKGRDRLLELSSFRPSVAADLVREVQDRDADTALDRFMLDAWDYFGIFAEALRERTYKLEAGSRFNEAFPHFGEGMVVTFDRREALISQNVRFLTWDHPMVTGAVELLIGSQNGNCAFAVWARSGPPAVLLEAIFVLEVLAPPQLHLDRFLPPTPVRVVVDHEGRDQTPGCRRQALRSRVQTGAAEQYKQHRDAFKALLPDMLAACRKVAEAHYPALIADSLAAMEDTTGSEIQRLNDLKAVNPHIRDEEIDICRREQTQLREYIRRARPRLDALRLIWTGRN